MLDCGMGYDLLSLFYLESLLLIESQLFFINAVQLTFSHFLFFLNLNPIFFLFENESLFDFALCLFLVLNLF